MEKSDIVFEMTREELLILRHMEKGREKALSVARLMEITGMTGVDIRLTIRHLIMDHNILIASATAPPAGFYISETPEEIRRATESLRHRGISILARAAKLQRLSLEEIFHQSRLEWEKEASDAAAGNRN